MKLISKLIATPAKSNCRILTGIVFGLMVVVPLASNADTTFTITSPTADAFLASGSPGNPIGSDLTSLNFGGAGTLAIAPASSTKGQFDSIVKFNLSGATSQFNSTYGAGNWAITGLTLKLASNFGVQGVQPGNNIFNVINGGSFGVQWLSYNNWVEGTGAGMGSAGFPGNSSVSFQSISTLFSGNHDSLGTFTYTPPGNNIYLDYTLPLNSDLLADASNGGDVSLYFNAADNQVGYLFNARSFSANFPEFVVTATAAPEPGTLALTALLTSGFLALRKRTKNI